MHPYGSDIALPIVPGFHRAFSFYNTAAVIMRNSYKRNTIPNNKKRSEPAQA